MTTAAIALGTLLGIGGLLVAGLRALNVLGERMRASTMDSDTAASPQDTPALVEPPAEIDEFTTDLELERRDHLALNGVESELRVGLDEAYAAFLNVLGVAAEDLLLEQPGFVGVHELVGGP